MTSSLVILLVILLTPMVCRKVHIPSIVGFIVLGMVLGPLGCGVIASTQSISVLGQLGMLYILFQSGSEIDMDDFRTYYHPALRFGLYTFLLPLALGLVTSRCLLHTDWTASLLMGAMYGSHTLMTYPIVSRYGLQKNKSVTVVVGGTMLATTLSLLILAFVKNSAIEQVVAPWLKAIYVLGFIGWVFILVPRSTRWFFKRYKDGVADFLWTMTMLVGTAWLADWIGLDAILGAFLAGVSLNRLLPNHSPLMGRITFVGNSIFVPLFLLSVGMLIDVRVFVSGWTVLTIAAVMCATKLTGKWLAAALAKWDMKLSGMERQLVFGMSHATAAGTLAVVTIGFSIGVLSAEVLNASVVMILVLCTISSFVTEHAAKQLALQEEAQLQVDKRENEWIVTHLIADTQSSSGEDLRTLAAAASLTNVKYLSANDWTEISHQIEQQSASIAVYGERQPMNTINRLLVAVPRYAEKEHDFITCFGLIRRLSKEIGAKVVFYANEDTRRALRILCERPGKTLRAGMCELDDWEDVLSIRKDVQVNDMLVLLSSRQSTASYNPLFSRIPDMLVRFYASSSYLVIYPEQQMTGEDADVFLMDHPQSSKSWSVVTALLNRLRRWQRIGQ